jgi:DNA repair protein RecO (recombination protein O)
LFAPEVIQSKKKLVRLGSLCAMLNMVLPERENQKSIYELTYHLVAGLGLDTWYAEYIIWECLILQELGFGLDLVSCAATGIREQLIYVSPKSGRAVSKEAGEPYKERLLHLPEFIKTEDCSDVSTFDILQGLKLTAFFLTQSLLHPYNKNLPPARENLIRLINENSS